MISAPNAVLFPTAGHGSLALAFVVVLVVNYAIGNERALVLLANRPVDS